MAEKPAAKKISKKSEWKEFTVNLWATDINDVEIGIMPATKARAKSRQFTKDMDVVGEVTEGGERTGIVAYREALWEENDGMDKRLVIKLFSASMNWKGTMDLLIGRSLQLTHGAGKLPVTAYSVKRSLLGSVAEPNTSERLPAPPTQAEPCLFDAGLTRFCRRMQSAAERVCPGTGCGT